MKKTTTLFLSVSSLLFFNSGFCQHTFSIVAVDSITGEVGGAGASCIDVNNCCTGGAAIINDVHPGLGVIHCQAYLNDNNRAYAKTLMNQGYFPCQIIDSLLKNDDEGFPQYRQYGVIGLYNGHPQACAFTGSGADNYKNHIFGRYYSIQGNTLLGQKVLDSMEARFLRARGDLACRLMEALQGAKMVGADTRCAPSNNSSLSSFIRVAKPGDNLANLYMDIVVDKGPYGYEPIDSLQKRFTKIHSCAAPVGINSITPEPLAVTIYPNPFTASTAIKILTDLHGKTVRLELYDYLGKIIKTETFNSNEFILKKENIVSGLYFYKIIAEGFNATGKLVISE